MFHIFIQDYTVFKIVHLFYFLILNLRTLGRPGTQIWNIQLFCFAILYGKEKYNKQKLNKRDKKNTANQTKRITSTSLCWASFLDSQHDATRIYCWARAVGLWHSAANHPHAADAVDWRDRRTDGHTTVTFYAGNVNNKMYVC